MCVFKQHLIYCLSKLQNGKILTWHTLHAVLIINSETFIILQLVNQTTQRLPAVNSTPSSENLWLKGVKKNTTTRRYLSKWRFDSWKFKFKLKLLKQFSQNLIPWYLYVYCWYCFYTLLIIGWYFTDTFSDPIFCSFFFFFLGYFIVFLLDISHVFLSFYKIWADILLIVFGYFINFWLIFYWYFHMFFFKWSINKCFQLFFGILFTFKGLFSLFFRVIKMLMLLFFLLPFFLHHPFTLPPFFFILLFRFPYFPCHCIVLNFHAILFCLSTFFCHRHHVFCSYSISSRLHLSFFHLSFTCFLITWW